MKITTLDIEELGRGRIVEMMGEPNDYIVSSHCVNKQNIKPNMLGSFTFIHRKDAEHICKKHFGWGLPYNHNLIIYNDQYITVIDEPTYVGGTYH